MRNDGFTCVANTIFKLLLSYLHVSQTLCLHHNYKWSKDDEYCLYSIFTLTANTKQKKCFLRFDDLCTKSKLHVCRYLHSVANAKKIQLYCGSKYKVKDGFAWMPKTIFASLWSCLRRSQMSCLTIVCKESIAGKILNLLILYISCKNTCKWTFAETLLWQRYTFTPYLFHVQTPSNISFLNSFAH